MEGGKENKGGYWKEEPAAFRKFSGSFMGNLLSTIKNAVSVKDINTIEWKRKKRAINSYPSPSKKL